MDGGVLSRNPRLSLPLSRRTFAALKSRNKTIGIFSDYPAVEKLRAMDLKADIVVSAADVGICEAESARTGRYHDRGGRRTAGNDPHW